MDSVRFFNKDLTDFSFDDSGRTVVIGMLTDDEQMALFEYLENERSHLEKEAIKLHSLERKYQSMGLLKRKVLKSLGFDLGLSDFEINKRKTTFCGIADVVFLNKILGDDNGY